jgi:endonuclease III
MMTLELPDVCTTLEMLMPLKSRFESSIQPIEEWVKKQRIEIEENVSLTKNRSNDDDMKVLRLFLRDLLMRNMIGEVGETIYNALCETVPTKDDLTQRNLKEVMKRSRYRWEAAGLSVMTDVVAFFRDKLRWNWKEYLEEAEREKELNFPDDPLLDIKYVKFKVRDLALSNFNSNYAAFDLHVRRVVSRIGLVAYGWDLTSDPEIDFGTDPSDKANYLFFHRLFRRLASLSKGRFTPVDLDRIFWHLGQCRCGAKTQCANCPIREICMTGRQRWRK